MDEKQLQFLFNEYAKNKGFKDFGEFKSLMDNEGSRKVFFDDSNKELGFKDYNDFNETLGLKKKEPTLSVSSNTPLPSRVPKESSPYLKGLDFKSVTEAVKADKQTQSKNDSVLGGLYNSMVGVAADLAGGVALAGSFGGSSSMGGFGGGGVNTVSNKERVQGALAMSKAANELVQKARTSSSSKENEQKIGEFNTDNGVFTMQNLKALGFQAPSQLLGMGAAALTGGGSFVAQNLGSVARELEETPNSDKLTANQKLGYITTQAAISAALEKLGLDAILKSTGLGKRVTKKIATEITEDFIKQGIKATAKEIQDAAISRVSKLSSKIKQVGLKTATSFLTEGGTESAQSGTSDIIKLITNKAVGKEIFNEKDIIENFGKNMLNSGLLGGATGGILGGGMSMLSNTNKAIRNDVAQSQTPQDLENIRLKIAEQYEIGNITKEEAEAANIKSEQYAQIAAKIPTYISPEKKYAIIGGIEQRELLKKEIENTNNTLLETDPAFQEDNKNKLTLLEAKLGQTNDYINDIVTDKKTKYIKDGDKFYKIDSNGENVEINKEYYDIANAIKEEDKAKKEIVVEQPKLEVVFNGEKWNIKEDLGDTVIITKNGTSEIKVNKSELENINKEAELQQQAEVGQPVIETVGEVKPTTEVEKTESKGLVSVDEKEVIKKIKPFTDEMVNIEREFKNKGFDINTDYDNEIQVLDKNGEQVEPSELPESLKQLAANYENATRKLGEFDENSLQKALKESRNIEEVKVETPKLEQPKTVEQLRAEEKAEYAAMTNPNDELKKEEIYKKYDKLITPLIREQKLKEPKVEKTTSDIVYDDLLTHLGITQEPEGETKPAKKYNSKNIDTISGEGLTDTQKKVVGDVKNVVKSVSKLVEKATGNQLEVNIHETPSSYEKAVIDAGGTKQDSTTKGFYLDADGTIHLNMEKVTKDTMLHEGFHPILDYMAKYNPKIIDKLHSQLAGLKGGQDIIDNAKEIYDGDITQKKEAITDYIAKIANGDIELDRNNFQKVKDWIIDTLKSLGLPIDVKIESIKDIQDLAKNISEKFATGEEIYFINKNPNAPSGYVSKDGKPITNKEAQFSVQNDFSDVKTKVTFSYIENAEDFEKLKKDGYITENKKLSDFKGKYIFLHSPDAAFTGEISKNGDVLIKGNGGVYYPIRFHKDGYFWASTETAAKSMAAQLNGMLDKNGGTIYMALTSAPADKLLSSTTASNAVVDFFSSKAMDKTVGLKESSLKKALLSAANDFKIVESKVKDKKTGEIKLVKKKVGLDLNLNKKTTVPELKEILKTKLAADNSIFADRKHFTLQLIGNIANEISGTKAEQVLGRFFKDGILNSEMKGQLKGGEYKLSAANMTQALSYMLSEPMLRGEESGKVYAVIEINGKVKAVDSKSHDSYPKAIQSEDVKNKVKLHILQDRENWVDNFADPMTGNVVEADRKLQVYPTSGVSIEPLLNIGGKGIVSEMGGMPARAAAKPQFSKEKKIEWEESKEGKGDPSISARNPIVQEAAKKLQEGKITNEEYRAVASENSPIRPITRFFEPASEDRIKSALSEDKKDKVNVSVDNGKEVGLRLDIPAYKNNNTWVVSIHEGTNNSGKAISYTNVAKIKDVNFGVEPKGALAIASGVPKATIGRMFGKWENIKGDTLESKGENAKKIIQEISNDPNYVQVGMNPFRHSYFYDRSSDIGRPIKSAEEVIQVGGLVYAKKPIYGEWTDESYRVKGLLDAGQKPIQFSKENQDSKIKDFIEIQRQKGVSDKDIQVGLEKASEKIGIDKAKIDELMSTAKVEEKNNLQSQYEAIKDIKSKKAQEKAKEKLINDNFESIVSQLMLKNKIKRIC